MSISTFLRRRRAEMGGYFWLPCPICGENFGGFECGEESLRYAPGCGKIVCQKPSCNAEAIRRNDAAGIPRFIGVNNA